MKHFHDEVASFQNRLRLRAKQVLYTYCWDFLPWSISFQKRDDALAEYEAEEKQKRIAEAPGGLDPQEVTFFF